MKKEEEMESFEDVEFVEENSEVKSGFSSGRKKEDSLKEKIKVLEGERNEYLDGWQRARAEMVNLKKSHLEEKKLFTSLGKESFLEDVIPILDNFDAAFSNKEA
jgi:molecular chaperone GrpE (heat shock protein)